VRFVGDGFLERKCGVAGPALASSSGCAALRINEEELLADRLHGFELEPCSSGQARNARAFRDRWSRAPAENQRANGEVHFIHQAGAEEGVIKLAAAFAKQALDFPFLAQPGQSLTEIDLDLAADDQVVGKGKQLSPPFFNRALRCENEDRRELMAKDLGIRIYRAGAGDKDPQIVLVQAAFEPQAAESLRTRPKVDFR